MGRNIQISMLVLFSVFSVAGEDSTASERLGVFSVQMYGCWGSCPTYFVDLRSNGIMRFIGQSNVAFDGNTTLQLESNLYEKLKSIFLEFKDKSYKSSGCYLADGQSIKITLDEGADYSSVSHSFGCTDFDGEEDLLKLIDVVQLMLPIEELVGKQSEY